MHERIAEIDAARLTAAGGTALLERAAALGFDTLLVSDFEQDIRAFAPERPALAALVDAASTHGIGVWLVVAPDAAGAPRFDAHAAMPLDPWLVDDEAALDPRRPPRSLRMPPVVDSAALQTTWKDDLQVAVDAGVAGFLCRDVDRLSTSFWSTLTKAVASKTGTVRWIAWTAGAAPHAVEALARSGFDTVTASVAWWDGRGRWLTEEFTRTAGVAKLVFPVDPFARHDGGDHAGSSANALTADQRLQVAVATGDALLVAADLWLASDAALLAEPNRRFAARTAEAGTTHLRIVTPDDAAVTALVVTTRADLRACDKATVLLVNPDPVRSTTTDVATITAALGGFGDLKPLDPDSTLLSLDPCARLELAAAGSRAFTVHRLPAVRLPRAAGRRNVEAGLSLPRLAIEAITPSVERGRFPVKRSAGQAVRVEADLIIDGHEMLAAAVLYRAAGDRNWREVTMQPIGNDRFAASFPLSRVGRHEYTIEAWRDVFASYRYELEKKSQAGLDVALELVEGRHLVEAAHTQARTRRLGDVTRRLAALVAQLLAHESDPTSQAPSRSTTSRSTSSRAAVIAALLSSQTAADLRAADSRPFATRPEAIFPIDAERVQASFSSWYELFPRSLGNPAGEPATHHGTFADVIERLPAVRAMGFDVLYFPPIHPIGRRNRKGRNNSLVAADDDPGSPYAIGSAEGGHDALHPELGTFDDFRRMRDAAMEHGLELALDFAIQCSPDHPWLKDHPGWFAWRPDGSIRYAENPPKKYEDIVNVDFYGGSDRGGRDDSPAALWTALRDVVLLWCDEGVRIFRVDNPHTKPLPFWEWMIGDVRAKYPDVIFLSEAFTRPKVMYRLAKAGFSQSYTYFTWRHTKQEFVDYLTELTGSESRESLHAVPRDFFRPNFFVNTPDINPVFLQRSGRAGFLIRAALAATLSGLWGVYSGFELCEGSPVPGKEDYLDSEKYQLRAWDWQRPGNIVAEITTLNRIRRENPALHTHLNVRFQSAFDANILYFMKATEALDNVLLVAINLDPYGVHEADFELPLWQWKRPDDATVQATDLLDGHRFAWQGKLQRMRLDPAVNPYAIWRVSL